MAKISSLTKIYGSNNPINLDNAQWKEIELGDFLHSVYHIAIKNTADNRDTIDVSKVKQIIFEIGIDSGVTNKPISIDRIVLDFNKHSSSDKDFNKISTFTRVLNMPYTFYIKPLAIELTEEQVTTGILYSVDINISPYDLGVN